MICVIGVFIVVFLCQSIAFRGPSRISPARISSSRLRVVEHLADCISNPKIAEAYGGLQSEFCYHADGINAQDMGALLGQITYMGLAISIYFLFKRNGLAEIVGDDLAAADPTPFEEGELWDGDGDSYGRRSSVATASKSIRDRGQRKRSIACPQCGGSGIFSESSMASASRCDLCDGTGSVPYTRPVSISRLPPGKPGKM